MRIFCQYNPQLDCFLKGLVEYVLDSYGNQLLLDDLEEIELIKDLPGSSDGRVIEGGKKIYRRRRAPAEPKTASKSWEPKEFPPTSSIWAEAAMKLVESGERHLHDDSTALIWLAGRGLDAEARARYRLGWLPPESDKYQVVSGRVPVSALLTKPARMGKTRIKAFHPARHCGAHF